jgi:hypothetical protein
VFINCRVYKDPASGYVMKSRYTVMSDRGEEQNYNGTKVIAGQPKFVDSLEIGNKYMLFGNNSGGNGFTLWDWRVYPRFVNDAELDTIKTAGKNKIGYMSANGLIIPRYFLLDVYMNRGIPTDLVIHPTSDPENRIHNESFTAQAEQKQITYICVPSQPDRIYKIKEVSRRVEGYWTYLTLVDVDENGQETQLPISTEMLFNSENTDFWQYSFQKVVLGLTTLPLNFKNKSWLSSIYPTKPSSV